MCDFKYKNTLDACALLSVTAVVATLILAMSNEVTAKDKIDRNEIYAMVSGTALLMDVYYPKKSNGKGVLLIPGSGWYARDIYEANGLKEMDSGWQPGDELTRAMLKALTNGRYTVFVANHRAAPIYRYPDAVNDIAQAVRFIRQNAARYKIDSDHIGGVGHSSGGTLVSLMGVMDASPDGNSGNSKLQAIVTLGSPMDMVTAYHASPGLAGALTSYLGRAINFMPPEHPDVLLYKRASPTSHIDHGDAPHLLMHGSIDELVPVEQSHTAAELFNDAGVPVKEVIIEGGKHSEQLLDEHTEWLGSMTQWLDQYLN